VYFQLVVLRNAVMWPSASPFASETVNVVPSEQSLAVQQAVFNFFGMDPNGGPSPASLRMLGELRQLTERNPREVRDLLAGNPSLALAVLNLEIVCGFLSRPAPQLAPNHYHNQQQLHHQQNVAQNMSQKWHQSQQQSHLQQQSTPQQQQPQQHYQQHQHPQHGGHYGPGPGKAPTMTQQHPHIVGVIPSASQNHQDFIPRLSPPVVASTAMPQAQQPNPAAVAAAAAMTAALLPSNVAAQTSMAALPEPVSSSAPTPKLKAVADPRDPRNRKRAR
jgi:hypothetical protein